MTGCRWRGRWWSTFIENTRAKTLFATHYHELTELAEQLEGVRNLQVAVKEAGDRLFFCGRWSPARRTEAMGSRWRGWRDLPRRRDRARAGGFADCMRGRSTRYGRARAAD